MGSTFDVDRSSARMTKCGMFTCMVFVGAGDGLADFPVIEVGELLLGENEGFGFGDAGTVGVAGEEVEEVVAVAGGVGEF